MNTNAESQVHAPSPPRPSIAATIVNIFASPGEAYAALAARPSFIVPLLALVLGNCALVAWYYSQVDIGWLVQTSLEAAGQELPPEVREQAAAGPGEGYRMIVGTAAAVASGVVVLVVVLLMAGYLSGVSLLTNDGVSFKRWLSLVSWGSLPVVLGLVASTVNLALNDVTFLPPTQIDLFSLGNLLGIDAAGGGLSRGLLHWVSVPTIWALALIAFGYRAWTGKSPGVALVITAAPLATLLAGSVLIEAL
jgi:hypothetical protein